MISRAITEIGEGDLRALIENSIGESKTLEYKRELPDSSDQGKIKFLRSLAAFANTAGGDLVYGIRARDGVPEEITPLPTATLDQTLLRLEQLCADGVEPRMTGLQFHPVTISAGGYVLVIRISRSWNSPHRVTLKGHSHFYGRNASGAYPLDVAQLRRAFTLSADTADRIRAFRADRLLAIGNGDTPIDMREGGMAVLHVIPLEAFANDVQIPLAALRNSEIPPLGSSGYNFQANLDGWLSYRSDKDGKSFGYAQIFRNGAVEAVDVLSLGPEKVIASISYEEEVFRALSAYFRSLRSLGASTPAYVFYGMLGVMGYRFGISRLRAIEVPPPLRRDALLLPEIAVHNWSDDPVKLMQPAFDRVWNAFGLDRSFNYDEQGNWVGA